MLNKEFDEGVRGRSGGDTGVDVEFVNDGAPEDDPRTPTVNRTGTLLEELQRQRNREDNPYDNPPNADEVFW